MLNDYKSVRTDCVSRRLVDEFSSTLDGMTTLDENLAGIHWCLSPDTFPPDKLGRDGHPLPGIVLPALNLPRRMWAGGELTFHHPLKLGDVVKRVSAVQDIRHKTGKTGLLNFVTIGHEYHVGKKLCLSEIQNLVYRDEHKGNSVSPLHHAEVANVLSSWSITPSSTLLFRYSAMTFNGHRIHYDYPYATEVEGYAGLVVHGPMQATWMLNLATSIFGALPRSFSYRGLSPLICNTPVTIEAIEADDGLSLRVRCNSNDSIVMIATARSS